MNNIAILGAAYGDEAKGSMTHHFSKDYDWVIRFSGGANAGHTIYRDGVKYVHNLIPSFDWRSSKPKAFLGAGMVIDLEQLLLETSKITKYCNKIYVDPDAFIVLPIHKEEDKKQNGHIGSTNRGIGPAYRDKISRTGLRIRDLSESCCPEQFARIKAMEAYGVRFMGLLELRDNMSSSSILYEGAQGAMLDINHGTYPFVSCGNSTIGGIYSSGFHFAPPKNVYGVAKCYSTKVGEGPFPTEIFGEEAEDLRKVGNEYGATTGRPRRIGWIDLPALDYACKVSGITDLILTKFDVLDERKAIKICNEYDKTPMSSSDFFNANTKYIEVAGWQNGKDLNQIKHFIDVVENKVNLKVRYISAGIKESDIIKYDVERT